MSQVDLKSFIPKEPETLYDLKINTEIVNDMIFKELHIHGKRTPRQIGKSLRIKPDIIQKLINDLKQQEMVGMVGGTGMGSDYQYGLYPKGIERAKNIYERDSYLGAAPVGFEEYVRITKDVLAANKKSFAINQKILTEKFAHHLGYKDVLIQIGQAVRLGSVTVLVQRRTKQLRTRRHRSHEYFENRLIFAQYYLMKKSAWPEAARVLRSILAEPVGDLHPLYNAFDQMLAQALLAEVEKHL